MASVISSCSMITVSFLLLVLVQPQTRVALPGVSTTFTCEGHGKVEPKVNKIIVDNTPGVSEYLTERNITNECQGEGATLCSNTISRCVMTIIPTISTNNNTALCCYFNRGNPCFEQTEKAKLIIVTGIHILIDNGYSLCSFMQVHQALL